MNWPVFFSGVGVFVAIFSAFFGVQKYNQGRLSRVYERFDNFKKEMEDRVERNYVRKDVHDIRYQQMDSDIKEIKLVTACLPSVCANLNLLLAKNGIANGKD